MPSRHHSRPRLLLFHPSDLFYASGTAIIYRNLLQLLQEKWEIHHYISTWRSGSEMQIRSAYRETLNIIPHFAPFKEARDLYGRISRRWNQNVPDLRFPGLLDARQIRQVIRKIQPDVVWWSGDYLPISLVALKAIPQSYFSNRRLLFSLYDPPTFWDSGKWDFKKYLPPVLQRADGVDVIGKHMANLVVEEGFGGKPVILNDYVQDTVEPAPLNEGHKVFKVAITGQVYGKEYLQKFVDILGSSTSFSRSEVHWFGNEQNLSITDAIHWPSNVELIKRGTVSRSELIEKIRTFHAGYLNMPQEVDGFSKFSVPTKLITYLEAGLPVVYHTPEDAEIHAMNREYRFGENLEINPSIETITTDRTAYQNMGRKIIDERYKKSVIKDRLLSYLG